MNSFQKTWLLLLAVLLVGFWLLGVWIRRRPLGVLIDARCRMSLSRLQVLLWSWLLISAFFAVAATCRSMNIQMDPEIWALMGISVGSAAGAVIVKGTKAGQEPSAVVPTSLRTLPRQGLLAMRAPPAEASLSDLFTGEEVTDHTYVDISKVQMFFFTLAMVLGYAGVLWSFPFHPSDDPIAFPKLSQSLVILLGISHTGYLTVKAAPKTPTG